jgi:aerobic-type carbon monoxide dehydrogenase small subunit (CoxS/CutS family)
MISLTLSLVVRKDCQLAHRILDHPLLGELPPARNVTISIDGREIEAREGEPVAAALLVNGVRVFRTMPRTGEARGGYCLIGRCSDCLMKVDGELNVRVCIAPVKEGMRVETQRGLGEFDHGVEP